MPRSSFALAFAATAFAFVATMLGTTMPTPLYPTYQQQLGFGTLTVTIVFATYAIGVLAALLAFGRASDTVGRRPTLLAGAGGGSCCPLLCSWPRRRSMRTPVV